MLLFYYFKIICTYFKKQSWKWTYFFWQPVTIFQPLIFFSYLCWLIHIKPYQLPGQSIILKLVAKKLKNLFVLINYNSTILPWCPHMGSWSSLTWVWLVTYLLCIWIIKNQRQVLHQLTKPHGKLFLFLLYRLI